MTELIKLEIKNKNYGGVKGTRIFITPQLKTNLESIKSDRYGNLFKSLETTGFRGGKHLLETLKKKLGGSVVVILSHEKSRIKDNTVIINYEDYRKIGSSAFFSVYRQVGLDTAYKFLSKELPDIAPELAEIITRSQTEKVIKTLPRTTLVPKTQNLLTGNIARMIRESKIDRKKLTPEVLKEIKAASNQAYYKDKLDEFNKRLEKKLSETTGKNSWQKWIYSNTWIFGVDYLEPIEKGKVGFSQIPDYLFPTVDGFLDILEIKVPHRSEIIKEDKSHKGSYYWDQKTSEAIGQVANYLHELEKNQLQVAQNIRREYRDKYEIEISTVKPRAIILIGRTEAWNDERLEGLRTLNFSLHGIEVISYDQLLKRGEGLVRMFDKEVDTKKRER
ncbi:MAG: DUF4263 domain-containing protein [Candidatus Altiarchaeota archaeon]|nr:DUF4263 domain-containing protein [Candidatus Altiarchaeota archaeon]